MTQTESELLAKATTTVPTAANPGEYLRTYLVRIRSGDMGSLPAILALVLLVLIFSLADHSFFTLGNFANLIVQAAPTVLLAMGLVFVLLLGEIDLSAGTAAGSCAAVMAALLYKGWVAWPLAVLAAVATGMLIGLLIGVIRAKLLVPSFVITLALFLALQGLVLLINYSVIQSGAIPVSDNTINAIESSNMPTWLGWVLLAIAVVGFAAVKLADRGARAKRSLALEPVSIIAAKVVGFAAIGALAVIGLNANRALNRGVAAPTIVNGHLVAAKSATVLNGVPWVVPLVAAIIVIWTFVLGRTRYGRHIYAVGGSEEAARRAGIRVDAIRVSVFVLCSGMAALAGIALASQGQGVPSATGSGNTLLLAVGAAVIGGTSLFGGKGRIIDGMIGGLVLAVIANGMADIVSGKNSQAVQYIVTGAVLAAAATVDALSRRRSRTRGTA